MDPFVVQKRGVLKAAELELPEFLDVSLFTSKWLDRIDKISQDYNLSIVKNLINPVY